MLTSVKVMPFYKEIYGFVGNGRTMYYLDFSLKFPSPMSGLLLSYFFCVLNLVSSK